MEAVGLLEVQALVAAIEGLDAMLKAANVRLVHVERRLGGRLVTMVIAGSVSAVTSAIEAGKTAAGRIGNVKCCEIIPRPHSEIIKFFTNF